jgi:hypothetical protein
MLVIMLIDFFLDFDYPLYSSSLTFSIQSTTSGIASLQQWIDADCPGKRQSRLWSYTWMNAPVGWLAAKRKSSAC